MALKNNISSDKLLSKPIKFHIQLLHPKHLWLWLLLFIAWSLNFLPFKARLTFGRRLGILIYHLSISRRKISYNNLKIALPDKTCQEIKSINRQHFQSVGIGLMEMIYVWWGNYRTPKGVEKSLKTVSYYGLEHLKKAQEQDKGVLMLSYHTTHTEMVGLLLFLITEFHPLYRPYDNPVMEYLNRKARTQLVDNCNNLNPILYKDTRTIIRALKAGGNFFYLPDQKYTGAGTVDVPFFNKSAPTNPATHKLAKITGCQVVPFFTKRDETGHYHVTFQPALQGFPSNDSYSDTLKIHKIYEAEIIKNPSQYLWIHDRWNIKDNIK